MRLRLALVSLSAAAALFVTSGARAQNVRWDADGTKTLTTDGWTIAGVQGDGLTKSADFSTGQADAGTNGVWSINDSDSTRYMRMYRDPVGISSTQGLVMSRVEFVSGGNTNGTFGYSSASGNHSVVVGVRDGAVNIKDAQGNTTTYNGGTSVTVPGGTLSYRIYALRWYYDATPAFRYDLWVSDGSDWSANPSDWTQLVSAGAFSSQSALIDHNGVSRTGLLLGSFGNTTTLWQGKIDYIIWSGRSAEQRPWHFAPTSGGLVDNATPTGDTIPATMFPGLTYSVSVTMQNTGNSYWQSVGEYKLGAVGSDPFAGGRQNMSAGPTVAPGSAYTFEFNMTAPQTEGTYTTDWQMVRELVSWFGGIDAKQVQVTWGASPPAAPIVVSPARGEVLGANRPDLVWEGDPHDAYQVRINTVDNPDSSIVWDSGQVWYSGTVTSTGTAMSGSLTPSTNHYVFVRVHNARGWGAWSAYNQRVFVSGELINDPYLVSGGGLQWWDYVCYNPDRNEYCITWQNGYVIHWRRLDSTGANIGSEMVLSDNSSGHHFSVVCYNSVQHEYLIEYVVWMADDSAQVRVLRVDATTGNQIGSPIWLYSTGGVSTTGGIRVAYSPTSNSYLATYEAYSEGGIVYGQILSSTGNPVGSNFRISTTSQLYSRNPAIAWNSTSDEYMVTYQGYITAPSWDYWGQRIRASDGALLGSNLAITTTHDIGGGGVAYDPVMNRYLVVYEAGGDSPWGQFVSSTPTLIGSRFAIGGGDFVGWGPSVCWDSSKKEFLVTWSASGSYDNFSRRISETGDCIGEAFRNNGNWIGIGNWPPAPVYNSVNDEFLIHWYNSYAYVLVRRYKTYTVPPTDTTPPGPVTSFTATSGDTQNVLNWTNPTDPDFIGTIIVFKTTGYPLTWQDGTALGDFFNTPGSSQSYTHTGLTNGVTHYYSAFSHDFPNFAPRAQASATPADVVAPSPVTGFSAVANGQEIDLNWTNPLDSDFTGTMIRFKTTGYPTSKTDGNLLCDRSTAPGAADSYVHAGVGSATYYYSAFAHDEAPNYSSASNAQATPDCMADQYFGDNFDGYSDGNLGGQGGWTTTGAASAQVQSAVARSGKAALMDTIASGGAAIANKVSFSPKSSGYYYLTIDVNQDAGGAFGQAIGYVSFLASDLSEIGRLHIQKSRLMVEYGSGNYAILTTTAANLTWYNVKIGFNVDSKKMDLWLDGSGKGTNFAWKGAGANLAAVVIGSDRNANLNPQKTYIDTLTLDIRPGQVAQVTDDGAWTPSSSKLHFTFDPVTCAVEYHYAVGTTSGGTEARGWTGVGLATDVLAAGLALADDQTYYVSVQVGTGHGTWGASRTSSGIRVAPAVTIQGAKALADGSASDVKSLRGKVVTAVFPDCVYVQEQNSPFGIKLVTSASVTAGEEVDVCGVMRGSGSERYLDCTGNPVMTTSPGPGVPGPFAAASSALGGAELNSFTPGVVGGIGPNNIGSFVIAFGKVTQRKTSAPKYFYIDDGCAIGDGTDTGGVENVGMRIAGDPASYAEGSYVFVMGVVSCFDSAGLRPQILPTEIQILRGP